MYRFCLILILVIGFIGCGDSKKPAEEDDNGSGINTQKIPAQEEELNSSLSPQFKPIGVHNVKFAGIEMIWVPAGNFQMGSSFDSPVRIMDEKPHEVELTRGFYLGKYQITQRQYALVMEENVRYLKP